MDYPRIARVKTTLGRMLIRLGANLCGLWFWYEDEDDSILLTRYVVRRVVITRSSETMNEREK